LKIPELIADSVRPLNQSFFVSLFLEHGDLHDIDDGH